ncbi:MAG: ATP-binding protein [bacterium]
MKFDRNSIGFRITIPIIGLISVITLALVMLVFSTSHHISKKYFSFVLSDYDSHVQGILDTAVNELIIARLFDKEVVVRAKQEVSVDEVASYWSRNDLSGLIIEESSGRVIYSSLDKSSEALIMHLSSRRGYVHLETGLKHRNLFISEFPAWGWKIITVANPLLWLSETHRSEMIFMFPVVLVCSVLTLALVLFIIKRNFRKPIDSVLSDVQRNHEVRATGIMELDTIGAAINRSVSSLMKKTEQYQTLHTIATSLHKDHQKDELLTMIIETTNQFIQAEISALMLYDEAGRIDDCLTRGFPFNKMSALPEGKGLLELVRLSSSPLKIDNVQEHRAFSGSFPEGHPHIHNLIAYPIFSDEGRPVGALLFANKPSGFTDEDMTILQAISADTALAISKTERMTQLMKFKQVIDSAFDVIMITDAKGALTYVNPAFTAVTGYAAKEVIGKKTDMFLGGDHDVTFYHELSDTIRSGKAWRGEFVNRKKNGEVYHTSAVIFPIWDAEGVGYATIQRDITQEKRLYEQLLRAQKLEAIGTLAGGMAHDFNNLLTAVLGYSEIMLSKAKEGDPFYKPAHIIMSAAEQGATLAKKILMVTRKETLETKPVSINEIIVNSKELLQRSIPRNIEIILNLAQDVPLISADSSQIQQVIMNLAVNARDAMPDGGRLVFDTGLAGTQDSAASGIPRKDGGFVKMSVSDTGCGMDSDIQQKVFDPFFTTKETGKGTGLGLYIVHSIVSNHGGYIDLSSKPLGGTRVSIFLPVFQGTDAKDAVTIENLQGSGTVLVIDDELHVRELCRDMMEPLGYKAALAEDGPSGIALFKQLKDEVAVVVLDMVMPKMSGYEVYKALKTVKPDIKVIVSSGYSQEGHGGIDLMVKEGAQEVIQKPFTRLTLARALARVLSGQLPSS